jgi:hypothetical protein
MRFIFSVGVFLILSVTALHAKITGPKRDVPKLDLGIKFGGNYDHISGNGWNSNYHTGYNSGIFLGFRESFFGIQGEALAASARYTHAPNTDINNLFLHVPVLFQIRLIPRVWLQAGPQYSFLLASRFAGGNNAADYFKQSGFSGVAGIQVFLPLHLVVGARYIFGLSDWNNLSTNNPLKLYTTQLYAGFKFL